MRMRTAEDNVKQDVTYIKFPDQKVMFDKIDKKWFHFGGDPLDEKELAQKFPNILKYVTEWRKRYEDVFDEAHKQSEEALQRGRGSHEDSDRYKEHEQKAQQAKQQAIKDFLEQLYKAVKEQPGEAEEKLKYVMDTIQGIIAKKPERLRAVANLVIAAALASEEQSTKIRQAAYEVSIT